MTAIDSAAGVADETPRPSNAGNMLIRRLKISGMLSFGPKGIDLPMEPLNVLIGPNGSGKSNFIEALALLQAAARDLSAPVRRMGGISEWLWKGDGAPGEAVIEAVVDYPHNELPLLHTLKVVQNGSRLQLTDEAIEYFREPVDPEGKDLLYHFLRGTAVLREKAGANPPAPFKRDRKFRVNSVSPEESVLSQVRDPEAYPALRCLQEQYAGIRMYRNWEFGPDAGLRQFPRADELSNFLTERGENLPLLLSKLRGGSRQTLIKSLQQLYDGIEDFQVEVGGGRAELFVVEQGAGERYIPASRLSDGTLRYMMLAAILLDPEPPPLVVIEEPELGIHPDVVLGIGEMLIEASRRTQLVVTTHSRVLVNALEDCASSVVVCGKRDGQSQMKRLDPEHLEVWLEKYSLGYLWSIGELGGEPLVTYRLYIEGGGRADPDPSEMDRAAMVDDNAESFRRGWQIFSNKAGVNGQILDIAVGGGQQEAFALFNSQLNRYAEHEETEPKPLLLVDSEEPVAAGHTVWDHLQARHQHRFQRPTNADDESAFMMVQAMETWFVADPPAL